MDYKELIEELLGPVNTYDAGRIVDACVGAADAIETLLAEREAAAEELRGMCWCCVYGKKWDEAPEWSKMTICEHMGERFGCLAGSGGRSKCPHWQWRGPTPPDHERAEG